MAAPGIPKINLADEVEKLRKYLALPITRVKFDPSYEYGKRYMDDKMNWLWADAKLFINDELIGTMPYFSAEFGFGYDTGNHSVLAWNKIYQQFQQVLFDKILRQEPLAVTVEPAEYEPRTSLMLNVKDKEGTLIKKAFCRFVDSEWEVSVFGLNTVTRTVRVHVTLTPPPSRTATDN
jgi:hypothetical protein